MKGGKNRQPLGYTIVEVMIVLAVSGLMFVIAASFINGKQQRATFTSGVNEMASQVQDVIEQVTDGKFSDVPLKCQFSGGVLTFTGNSNTQGTSTDCVFLGKLLSFSSNSSSYVVSSLAAGRLTTSTPTLSNVNPEVIPSLDVDQTVPQGLLVKCVSVTLANGTVEPCSQYYNFGFVQGLGTVTGAGTFQSGAQTVSLVYSPQSVENSSNDNISGSLSYAQSATLCLTDGTRTAKLLLGGSNDSQLNIDVEDLSGGAVCP